MEAGSSLERRPCLRKKGAQKKAVSQISTRGLGCLVCLLVDDFGREIPMTVVLITAKFFAVLFLRLVHDM